MVDGRIFKVKRARWHVLCGEGRGIFVGDILKREKGVNCNGNWHTYIV